MKTLRLPARYYQQFDADYSLDVPAEAYGGWKIDDVELSPQHTAVVVMHAWKSGTPKQYPGWHRAVEFLSRASQICRDVFPPLLHAAREANLPIFHVVDQGTHYKQLPGYLKAEALAGPLPPFPRGAESDPALERLKQLRREKVFVGSHNEADVRRGFAAMDFPDEARPQPDEGIAENAHQLNALCRDAGVNHLIYAGFALNWCLLMSSGGMLDMSRHGYMCSVFREAVTAFENKETARSELCKEIELWRVSQGFGFVLQVDEFIAACASRGNATESTRGPLEK